MSRKQTESGRRTEAAVHQAAVKLMAARGYHGTSLRTVAKEVGIQMASLYYYYPSKQALLVGIMQRTMEDMTAFVAQAIDEADGPVAKLEAGIRAHVTFHAERRRETLITDSELRALESQNRPAIIALRDAYSQMFIAILEDGRDQGVLEVADSHLAVNALMTMCTGVAIWYRPGGPLTLLEIADQYARLFLHGVTERASTPSDRGPSTGTPSPGLGSRHRS